MDEWGTGAGAGATAEVGCVALLVLSEGSSHFTWRGRKTKVEKAENGDAPMTPAQV